MKQKIVLLAVLMMFLSCDDGDFEVPSFEFDDNINSCGKYVLYRLNSSKNEALILNLSDVKLDEVRATPKTIAITESNLQYRIFSDKIGTSYFCQSVPPVAPTVVKEWSGTKGTGNTIEISTVYDINEQTKDTIGYKNHIVFNNMVLTNGDETIIYDIYKFGSYSVSKQN